MDTIGWVVIDGMSETPEFGIATSSASLSVDENIDNDMENKENVAITSTATPSNVQEVGSGHPLKRKRSTVISCLKEIINKDEKKRRQN